MKEVSCMRSLALPQQILSSVYARISSKSVQMPNFNRKYGRGKGILSSKKYVFSAHTFYYDSASANSRCTTGINDTVRKFATGGGGK
jgi:hypothetical protein